MIKIKISKDTVTLSGHANYNKSGKDIVCACVSSIVMTSVNDIKAINENALKYKDNGKLMKIKVDSNDLLVFKLFTNLKELLKYLASNYPKNIKIESEE